MRELYGRLHTPAALPGMRAAIGRFGPDPCSVVCTPASRWSRCRCSPMSRSSRTLTLCARMCGERSCVGESCIACGGLDQHRLQAGDSGKHAPVGFEAAAVAAARRVALLCTMVVIEARSDSPLIPLRFFASRTRVVANFASLFSASAFLGWVFLMTLFEQQVLHYSLLQGGLGYLPLGFGIGAGMGIGTVLMSARSACRAS